MSGEADRRQAMRMLEGLEGGSLTAQDAWQIAGKLDPVLVYFVLRYLREKYPPANPQSSGVIERIVGLTGTYDDVVKRSKSGEKDVIREWFDDSHEIREFYGKPGELIDLLIDKIEG